MGAANKLTLLGGYSDNGIGATAGRLGQTYLEMAIKNGQKMFSDIQERKDKEDADARANAAEKLLSLSEKRPLTQQDYDLAGMIDRKAVREGMEDRTKLEATIKHWDNSDRNNDPVLLSALKREEAKFNIANGMTAKGGSISYGRSGSGYRKSGGGAKGMSLTNAAKMYETMGLDSGDALRLATLREQRSAAHEDPTVVDRYVQEKGKGGIFWGDVDMPNTGYAGPYGTDYNKLKEELGRYAVQSQMGPNVYK